jgi:RNA polymerase sigma-70 factor (ECF subfamily)
MSPDPPSAFDDLLVAARAGRPSAWDHLFRTYSPGVAGYLRMRGARDVDDLTSEVFLAVFRNIETFTGTEANFRSWIFVIAHRRLQDERRRRIRRPADTAAATPVEAEYLPSGRDVETDALRALATERVEGICKQLAPDQGDVLLLRIVGDLTIDQVAEVLGKTPGAVKQLQRRGFEAVRRLLLKEGVTL